MDYIVPESHLKLLQSILMELILVRDQDAVFLPQVIEPDPEPKEKALGEK